MKVVVVPKFTSASLGVGQQGYHSGRAPPLRKSPCTPLRCTSVNESEKGDLEERTFDVIARGNTLPRSIWEFMHRRFPCDHSQDGQLHVPKQLVHRPDLSLCGIEV